MTVYLRVGRDPVRSTVVLVQIPAKSVGERNVGKRQSKRMQEDAQKAPPRDRTENRLIRSQAP